MLKMGLIGAGKMGKTHLFNMINSEEIDLVAVADTNVSNLKFAQKYGISDVFENYEDLLSLNDLDAVVISLPNFLRSQCILCAAENGKHVFADKPLARTLDEAIQIQKIVQKAGIFLMVNTNYRFLPHVQKAKAIYDEGNIGDVEIATLENLGCGPFSHGIIPTPVPEWWFNRDMVGGGAVIDLGYHLVDLFNRIFPNTKLLAAHLGYRYGMDLEDSGTILLRSDSTGTKGVINAGWFCQTQFPRINFRMLLHGMYGYVNSDELKPQSLYRYAMKTALANTAKKIAGRRFEKNIYTYYSISHIESLKYFVANLKSESFNSNLQEDLDVMRLIDEIYLNAKRDV